MFTPLSCVSVRSRLSLGPESRGPGHEKGSEVVERTVVMTFFGEVPS